MPVYPLYRNNVLLTLYFLAANHSRKYASLLLQINFFYLFSLCVYEIKIRGTMNYS